MKTPPHYDKSIQPWDAIAVWFPGEQQMGFLLGNVVKYVARFNAKEPGKGGLQDLLKARYYLDRAIAEEDKE